MEVTTETRKTHLPSNGNWLSKYLVAALVSPKVDTRANAHVACNVKELWPRGKCNPHCYSILVPHIEARSF